MSGDLNGQLQFACEAKWWTVFTVTEAYEVTEGKSAQWCGKLSRRTKQGKHITWFFSYK